MENGEPIKDPLGGDIPNGGPINTNEVLTENDQSLKLKTSVPEGWTEVSKKLLEAQKPEPQKKVKKPDTKVVHGFRLYRERTDGDILLQVGKVPQTQGAQVLISAIKAFIARNTGRNVTIGTVDGWTCPCLDTEDQIKDVEQIALLFAYEDYVSPKIGHTWFLTELFKLVHARMNNKNYEVTVPKGLLLTSWILRDAIRLLGSFRYEVLRQFVLRVPLSERSYMKLRFHDFDKFKSVLSEQEWKIMDGRVLDEKIAECKEVKSSLVHFKQFEYTEFCASNGKLAVEVFGKAAIAQIYQRINERNTLRMNLIRKKADPSVPLRVVLESLRNRNLYSGVHLLPAILKFRPGDLPTIQKITTIREGQLVPNDTRFVSVEAYLKYSYENPMSAADAARVVTTELNPEDFPALSTI